MACVCHKANKTLFQMYPSISQRSVVQWYNGTGYRCAVSRVLVSLLRAKQNILRYTRELKTKNREMGNSYLQHPFFIRIKMLHICYRNGYRWALRRSHKSIEYTKLCCTLFPGQQRLRRIKLQYNFRWMLSFHYAIDCYGWHLFSFRYFFLFLFLFSCFLHSISFVKYCIMLSSGNSTSTFLYLSLDAREENDQN